MNRATETHNRKPSRGDSHSPRRLSMLFMIVTTIFVVVICTNIVYSPTMKRALLEQGERLALSGLLEALSIAHPLAKAARNASPGESGNLLAAIGRQSAEEEERTGAFLPFIVSGEDLVITEESHLPQRLAVEVRRCFREGDFATLPLPGSSETAQVCQVIFGNRVWLAAVVPLDEGGELLGFAREITGFLSQARSIQQELLGLLVLCQMFFLIAFILVLRIITIPLRVLTGAAERFGRGDFSLPVEIPETMMSEVQVLASTFNHMGSELKAQHESLESYSRELEESNRKLEETLAELSRRNRDLRAMSQSSLLANRLALPEEVIELIIRRLREDARLAYMASYSLEESDWPTLRPLPGTQAPNGNRISAEAAECIRRCHDTSSPQWLPAPTLPADSAYIPGDAGPASAHFGERLYIPLATGIDRVEVLELVARPGETIDKDMVSFCRHFIAHMEVILKNKALYQETIRRSHELERINQISRQISGELDMDRLLRDVVDHTQNTIHAECVFVGVLEGGQVQIRHITPGTANIDRWVIDIGDSPLLNELIGEGRSILVTELAADPRVSDDDLIKSTGFRSIVASPITEKDEVIGVLCGFSRESAAFTDSDSYFLGLLAGQVAIALTNARLFEEILARDRRRDHQLKVAQNLQMNRIPSYFKHNVAAVSCQLQPADELAGDFCDVFPLGRNSIAVVVGDVANKGVAASLMTFSLLSMFRDVAKTHRPPCDIMEAINRSLISQIKDDYWFATAFYARLNTKKGVLTYSSAGHETPFWYHADTKEVEPLEVTGYPLGLFLSFRYETREIQLKQGDRIVFYTDGVTDAVDTHNNRFGHKALRDLVIRSGHLSGTELTDAIIEEVNEFTEGRKQRDDIIVAVLELEDDPWVRKSVTFADSSLLINEILESLAPYNLDKQTVYAIRLAVDEALTNAWRHGVNQRDDVKFEISYLVADEGFWFRVKDPGSGFEHESLPDPTVEENLFKSHGRGVFLIREMMDEVDFNEIGNEITVIKRFPPQGETEQESDDTLLLEHMLELKGQQESLARAKRAGRDDRNETEEPEEAARSTRTAKVDKDSPDS